MRPVRAILSKLRRKPGHDADSPRQFFAEFRVSYRTGKRRLPFTSGLSWSEVGVVALGVFDQAPESGPLATCIHSISQTAATAAATGIERELPARRRAKRHKWKFQSVGRDAHSPA